MLKVGIFGVGHLGKFHLNNWKEINQAELVGFFDPDDENAKEVEKKYALKRYITVDELVDKCDAIDIIAPTPFHFNLCEAAIKKGKHVFVEKPMADTLEQGKKIVQMVKEAGVKFQVGHVERFNPAFLALKNISLNPMFIEVHR